MVIDATDPADELEYKNSVRAFAAQRYVHVTLKLRSTAAIFGYLGQLIQSAKEGRVIALEAPVFHRRFEIPCWITDPEDLTCRPIFLASAPALPPPLVTVVYAGSVYSVPGDPATSFSPDVMALLKQLLALNLSAKSLPATATLSLTGPIR
jgi:hypothetical protein